MQHALLSLIDHVYHDRISLEEVVEKTAHNPAKRYAIEQRGYLREGYYADLVLVTPDLTTRVVDSSILYKCGWSPFVGHTFRSSILGTWVNGERVFDGRRVVETTTHSMALNFSR